MISVAEFLVILACSLALFLTLAVAAWILISRSRFQQSRERSARLEALDREYAAGDIDDAEYQRRRTAILDDRTQ